MSGKGTGSPRSCGRVGKLREQVIRQSQRETPGSLCRGWRLFVDMHIFMKEVECEENLYGNNLFLSSII